MLQMVLAAVAFASIVNGNQVHIVVVVDDRNLLSGNDVVEAVRLANGNSASASGVELSADVVRSGGRSQFVHELQGDVCALLRPQTAAILDLSGRTENLIITSLARQHGLLHLDATQYVGDGDDNGTLRIQRPEVGLLRVIRDIVEQENMTDVGIFYDQTFDMPLHPKTLLQNLPTSHMYIQAFGNGSNTSAILALADEKDLRKLFIAASGERASHYIALANRRGLTNMNKYEWFILTQDQVVNCENCSKASVVVMAVPPIDQALRRYMKETENLDKQSVKMSAVFWYDFFQLLAQSVALQLQSGWTTPGNTRCLSLSESTMSLESAQSLLHQMKMTTRSGVFGTVGWNENEKRLRMEMSLDIRRMDFDRESRSDFGEKIGIWNSTTGLMPFFETITNRKLIKTYRIVTVVEPPFIFKSLTLPPKAPYWHQPKGSEYFYYGYCISLISQLNQSSEVGFDFELYEAPDGAYGSMQPDHSWDGMIGELIADKADVAVGSLSVMAERENVIDFTVPYYDLVGITILMKKPNTDYTVFRFMTVLEEAVWGCIFSAFVIVSILLAIFDKFSPYSYQNNKSVWDGDGEEPRIFTLKESLWFCMTSLTPQGGGEAPRALSGRLVAATWWMFGFIMIATYTANLAAFLTVSRLDQPIESLDDLAKQFKTKYAPQKSTSTETYFKRMAEIEERFYEIWKSMSLNDTLNQTERAKLAVWDYPVSDKFTNMLEAMVDSSPPTSLEEAITRIKNVDGKEDFAFIGDATQNKYATLTDCKLWEVGEEFSRKPYALAVQEKSPLKNELSSLILMLLNERTLEDLKSFWWEFDKATCEALDDESDGINIKNIGGVFIVILIGIALGLLTLAFEYYWYKWRPSRLAANKPPETVDHALSNGAVSAISRMGGQEIGVDNRGYEFRK